MKGRKTWILGAMMVLLLAAGMGFSESGPAPSPPQKAVRPDSGPPAATSLWRYCRGVNPDSSACREMMNYMRGHWKKMRELREKVWKDMKDYCEKHHEERFCQRMRSGEASAPGCPNCWHR